MRVVHLITGLDTGGAETMLKRMIVRSSLEHSVVSLTSVGCIGQELARHGIDVAGVGMNRRAPNPFLLAKLVHSIRSRRPDVVKSWMYHADLSTVLLQRDVPVVWGVHNTTLDPKRVKKTTRFAAHACARWSRRVPWKIVFDSHAGAEFHVGIGYDRAKVEVIPNGFDLAAWTSHSEARAELRAALGLSHQTLLVGMVARFDPLKDHRNFVEAAARVLRRVPDAHFVLCGGQGIDSSNAELTQWIEQTGASGRIHLLGRVDDLCSVVGALDVGVSSSRAESFPLAVGELMSASIPCVVTDVGDSAYLLGEGGALVPPEDPAALAGAIEGLLTLGPDERRRIGEVGRERVRRLFSIEQVVQSYDELLRSAAASGRREV